MPTRRRSENKPRYSVWIHTMCFNLTGAINVLEVKQLLVQVYDEQLGDFVDVWWDWHINDNIESSF